MKKALLTIALIAALSGCAGSVTTKATTTVGITCDSLGVVLDKAADMKASGSLSAGQISAIDKAKKAADAVCLPDSPIDPVAVTGVVQSAYNIIKGIVG